MGENCSISWKSLTGLLWALVKLHYHSHENRHPDVLDILVCKNISGIISQQVLVELDSDHLTVVIEIDAACLTVGEQLKLIHSPVDWECFQDLLCKSIYIPSRFEHSSDVDNAVELDL